MVRQQVQNNLVQIVRARDERHRIQAHSLHTGRRDSHLRALRVRADQSARTEQNAAEIARDNANTVGQILVAQHLEDWHACRALRFSVIRVAHHIAFTENVGVAVVCRVPVGLTHFLYLRYRLLGGFNMPQPSGELGAFFFKFVLAVAGERHKVIFFHQQILK